MLCIIQKCTQSICCVAPIVTFKKILYTFNPSQTVCVKWVCLSNCQQPEIQVNQFWHWEGVGEHRCTIMFVKHTGCIFSWFNKTGRTSRTTLGCRGWATSYFVSSYVGMSFRQTMGDMCGPSDQMPGKNTAFWVQLCLSDKTVSAGLLATGLQDLDLSPVYATVLGFPNCL